MIKIPEWLAKLPKDAGINHKDFAKALGIKPSALQWRISKGVYDTPQPDFNSNQSGRISMIHTNYRGKNHWRAVTVRNYIRHLNRLELSNK